MFLGFVLILYQTKGKSYDTYQIQIEVVCVLKQYTFINSIYHLQTPCSGNYISSTCMLQYAEICNNETRNIWIHFEMQSL